MILLKVISTLSLLLPNIYELVNGANVNRPSPSKRNFGFFGDGDSIPRVGDMSGVGSGAETGGSRRFPFPNPWTETGGLGALPSTNYAGGGGTGGLDGLKGASSGSSATALSSNSSGGGPTNYRNGASLDDTSQSEGSSEGCPSYYMIGARGTIEGPTGSIAYNGLYQEVLTAIPGGAKEELQYSTSFEYSSTVAQGAQTEVELINRKLTKCPKAVFVLLGYSKGAMVQTQALNNNDIPQERIAAVVLFGNPYFRPGLTQDNCGANTGMGMLATSGITMPDRFLDRVFDCCAPGDPICQTSEFGLAHLTYASQHQNDAADFVIQKLKAKLFGTRNNAEQRS